jgi:DNA-binding CsgD family transcriptional regulator
MLLSSRFALTAAEIRVAMGIAEGRSPSEIAEALKTSILTVRSQ